MNGYTQDKDAYLKRMRRIEGQVRGIAKMIENDQYCIDVLTQVSAATRRSETVALGLLDEHLQHCVAQAAADGGARSPSRRSPRPAPRSPAWSSRRDHGMDHDRTRVSRHDLRPLRRVGHRGDHRAIDGVTDVAVDLPTGAVTVTSDRPLDDARGSRRRRGGGLRARADRPSTPQAGAPAAAEHRRPQPQERDMNTAPKLSAYGAALALRRRRRPGLRRYRRRPRPRPAPRAQCAPARRRRRHRRDDVRPPARRAGVDQRAATPSVPRHDARPAPTPSPSASPAPTAPPVTAVRRRARQAAAPHRRPPRPSGFQHVHPSSTPTAPGRVPLPSPPAGSYRAFADFTPDRRRRSTDARRRPARSPGDYQPVDAAGAEPHVPTSTATGRRSTATLVPGRRRRCRSP